MESIIDFPIKKSLSKVVPFKIISSLFLHLEKVVESCLKSASDLPQYPQANLAIIPRILQGPGSSLNHLCQFRDCNRLKLVHFHFHFDPFNHLKFHVIFQFLNHHV
jgi:hypothetical protein